MSHAEAPPTPPLISDQITSWKLVIKAGHSAKNYWQDLWRYRELFGYLAWRDILVRYKQTVIGVAWAVLRPALTIAIFALVFGKIASLPSEGLPYPLLVMAAMLPWQFFATSLTEASTSLITNSNLVTKVYFPRVILPASAVVVALVDFLITLVLLGGLMLWYNIPPGLRILMLAPFTLLALMTALGPGLLITALTVKYRDFRYVVPFLVQLGLYLSPVGFSSSVISQKFGETALFVYSLNPMVGVIDGFRWAVGGDVSLHPVGFPISVTLSGVLLYLGIRFFRHTERTFADLI